MSIMEKNMRTMLRGSLKVDDEMKMPLLFNSHLLGEACPEDNGEKSPMGGDYLMKLSPRSQANAKS